MRFLPLLVISLFLHLLLLCSVIFKLEKVVEKKIVHLKLKQLKKQQKITKKKAKKKVEKNKPIKSFKDLAYKKESDFDQYRFEGTDELGSEGEGSELIKIFESIYGHTTYPNIFIEKDVHGVVEASLFFLNGKYREKLSKFSGSNNFLKVHFVRILRAALGGKDYQLTRSRMLIKVAFTFAKKDQFSKEYIEKFNFISHNYLSFIFQPDSDINVISLEGSEQEKKVMIDFTRLFKEKTLGDRIFKIYKSDPAW